MRIIFVVEGKTEKIVYKNWVASLNKKLEFQDSYFDLPENSFAIVNGQGYPHYYEIMKATIEDINDGNLCDRLVLAIDSDELSVEEKESEVAQELLGLHISVPHLVVVQKCCFESWALGNIKAISPKAHAPEYRELLQHYDVRKFDPELMTPKPEWEMTKSNFAFKYLTVALRQKNERIIYSKSNPLFVKHHTYLAELIKRLKTTNHISSLDRFLNSV